MIKVKNIISNTITHPMNKSNNQYIDQIANYFVGTTKITKEPGFERPESDHKILIKEGSDYQYLFRKNLKDGRFLEIIYISTIPIENEKLKIQLTPGLAGQDGFFAQFNAGTLVAYEQIHNSGVGENGDQLIKNNNFIPGENISLEKELRTVIHKIQGWVDKKVDNNPHAEFYRQAGI